MDIFKSKPGRYPEKHYSLKVELIVFMDKSAEHIVLRQDFLYATMNVGAAYTTSSAVPLLS